MPGTVRKIIERIKEKRSGGNSVVALTVETRLVLQGFDPQRFNYDDPDDAGRLARIADIAREMRINVSDLLAAADVEPDPDAAPAAPTHAPPSSIGEVGRGGDGGGGASAPTPRIDDDHPLRRFRGHADRILQQIDGGDSGRSSGASFAVLLKSSVLMALYSIQKDSVFCDLLRHDVLFQWFLDLDAEHARFEPSAFFDDRERALNTDASRKFFDKLVPAAGRDKLFSAEVFQVSSVDFRTWMTPRGEMK